MTSCRGPAALRALEEPIGDGTGCFADLLADPRAADALERVPHRAAAEGLPVILALLTERERFVVSGRFGLGGRKRTLREIAADLDVSAERVRQIEQRALETLRALVAGPAVAPATDYRTPLI